MLVENGLFLFHRDLRIVDNTGLLALHAICERIYPVFIFTPEQVGKSNSFKSDNAIEFMIQSLGDLSEDIRKQGGRLLFFYGETNMILKNLIKELDIQVIGFNLDYSPYAVDRDKSVMDLCKDEGIALHCRHDYYLHTPGTIMNGSGEPYQKFTPFYNAFPRSSIHSPVREKQIHFVNKNIQSLRHQVKLEDMVKYENPRLNVGGGRKNAIQQLAIAKKNIANYPKTHNLLNHKTSELSAYIKFGCISIREVYDKFKSNREFTRQLIWREFYANILYCFPRVLGAALKPSYNKVRWQSNSAWFKKWCDGQTGYPIVDAGMRQLNATGYMHNRARLITASFLVKTLLISWEKGEQYFAQKLVDYDPASNNGNWQWTAGSGADSQPYFRIFNPWEQTRNYDPECIYIYKWVPELKGVPIEAILSWESSWEEYKKTDYPKPMVDYKTQKELALKMYRSLFH
jgi:deoxyribodipyrimidine photo-lyase